MKKIFLAFTLAEIMIVLTVIGVLTAILLPAAFHVTPDENVMKFKKANSTLGTVIRELVNSDEYYSGGDLGIRVDGTLIDGTHNGDTTYFCETFADLVSTKNVDCKETESVRGYVDLGFLPGYVGSRNTYKDELDADCKNNSKIEIETPDGIIFYQVAPKMTFGINAENARKLNFSDNPDYNYTDAFDSVRQFGYFFDENGMKRIYKEFCVDVDGIDKGEDPFGYGIRMDGKILPGARALEWINKSVQNKE